MSAKPFRICWTGNFLTVPSLSAVNSRFAVRFTLIEGGKGSFRAVYAEPTQSEGSATQLLAARRLIRVEGKVAVKAGMVVCDDAGVVYLLANGGVAEAFGTTVFRNYRMIEITGQYPYQRRDKVIDPTTMLQRDSGLVSDMPIWGCYEPTSQAFDGQMSARFDEIRFITNRAVARDEIVAGKKVLRVDAQLGVYIATLG